MWGKTELGPVPLACALRTKGRQPQKEQVSRARIQISRVPHRPKLFPAAPSRPPSAPQGGIPIPNAAPRASPRSGRRASRLFPLPLELKASPPRPPHRLPWPPPSRSRPRAPHAASAGQAPRLLRRPSPPSPFLTRRRPPLSPAPSLARSRLRPAAALTELGDVPGHRVVLLAPVQRGGRGAPVALAVRGRSHRARSRRSRPGARPLARSLSRCARLRGLRGLPGRLRPCSRARRAPGRPPPPRGGARRHQRPDRAGDPAHRGRRRAQPAGPGLPCPLCPGEGCDGSRRPRPDTRVGPGLGVPDIPEAVFCLGISGRERVCACVGVGAGGGGGGSGGDFIRAEVE